jgi:hypothetical protein
MEPTLDIKMHDCHSAENTIWLDPTCKQCTVCGHIWYLRDLGISSS